MKFLAAVWINTMLWALITGAVLADFTAFYLLAISGVLVCSALALRKGRG